MDITSTIDALTQCFPDLDRATLEDYEIFISPDKKAEYYRNNKK